MHTVRRVELKLVSAESYMLTTVLSYTISTPFRAASPLTSLDLDVFKWNSALFSLFPRTAQSIAKILRVMCQDRLMDGEDLLVLTNENSDCLSSESRPATHVSHLVILMDASVYSPKR